MQLAFVIPAFNEEGLIGRCLESVTKRVKQSGVKCEIIVVNNASTDRTKEIAEGKLNVHLTGPTFESRTAMSVSSP